MFQILKASFCTFFFVFEFPEIGLAFSSFGRGALRYYVLQFGVDVFQMLLQIKLSVANQVFVVVQNLKGNLGGAPRSKLAKPFHLGRATNKLASASAIVIVPL